MFPLPFSPYVGYCRRRIFHGTLVLVHLGRRRNGNADLYGRTDMVHRKPALARRRAASMKGWRTRKRMAQARKDPRLLDPAEYLEQVIMPLTRDYRRILPCPNYAARR